MVTKCGELSAREAYDRGFIPATVLVNGLPCKECYAFDDIRGYADVAVLDSTGHPQLDTAKDDIKTIRIYGKVEYFPNVAPAEYRRLYR